ncbi:MAG: hypothetical protein LUD69_04800 [Oscillospiraceae bacterium]|nr:hypothetical protein [Oscillospiraceae bacterium]
MTKQFTNIQVVNILNASADEKGKALREKRLPIRLLYAYQRSLKEMEAAYNAYNETRVALFDKYGADPSKELSGKEDPQFQKELVELLNMPVEVDVHVAPESVLDSVGTENYDTLTLDELDRISWLLGD